MDYISHNRENIISINHKTIVVPSIEEVDKLLAKHSRPIYVDAYKNPRFVKEKWQNMDEDLKDLEVGNNLH